ncbi:myozenin-3 [Eublepharis macularius]|uniref:Myozenin-3 n=1 Tax=Eublepharis macularius TaxID=481883 RepID=A0AA97J6Y5_EUBMA|nr:myozenin-3 [Eublepharis macularius]XP_054832215.1 myozenin-3 [Eublepharis macularius]
MFPLPRYDLHREKKMQAQTIVRERTGENVPELDLGKKVSIPQDLMMEELSLPINRGSRLYQQRQKRVQRFELEYPASYRIASNRTAVGGLRPIYEADGTTEGQMPLHNTEGKENYPTELHVASSGKGAPPRVPKKTEKVLKMSKALNPDSLAPGYSGPLKEVPPEKFNSTIIPKAYQSPWREFLSSEDYHVDSETRLPEPPKKVTTVDLRSFNRTPTPFGGLLLNDVYPVPGFEINEVQTDPMSGLELMLNRPSFNRAPQGWVQVIPESEEL